MLQEDPERTHLVPEIARIAAVYESTNQPLVQPAGRAAQPARGAVVALATARGYEVVMGLSLASGENVLYVSEEVADHELAGLLEQGLNFAESMGFILDPCGFPALDPVQKVELLARLPIFHPPQPKEPGLVQPDADATHDPLRAVARLLAAFAVALAALSGACAGMSAEQRAQNAEIHWQLGDNLVREGNPQEAMKEYLQSLDFEETPEGHLGLGLIDFASLGRYAEAEKELLRAVEMRPDYSEALTNLGALYIARDRFADAVPPLQKAAADALYKGRVIAQSDLGWALYKSGKEQDGVSQIRAALAVAPKYCLGWRQLGTIYAEQAKLELASEAFGKYVDACPDVADAHLQSGKVLARLSRAADARAEFERCAVPKTEKERAVAEECSRFLRQLGAP